jgi:hypothetical protein
LEGDSHSQISRALKRQHNFEGFWRLFHPNWEEIEFKEERRKVDDIVGNIHLEDSGNFPVFSYLVEDLNLSVDAVFMLQFLPVLSDVLHYLQELLVLFASELFHNVQIGFCELLEELIVCSNTVAAFCDATTSLNALFKLLNQFAHLCVIVLFEFFVNSCNLFFPDKVAGCRYHS